MFVRIKGLKISKINPSDIKLNEGTWALTKSIDERVEQGNFWISKIEELKENIYPIFGDDILFNGFDNAIKRINELMTIPESEISESMNEEVTIPPELANQYLSIKKQVLDKQTKKDRLMKSVNQVDNEINILSKNLIAIEVKAADLSGQAEKTQDQAQKQAAQAAQQNAEAVANAPTVESFSFSIDDWWKTHVTEGDTQDLDDYMNHEGDWGDEDTEVITEPDEAEDSESLEGDYVFTIKVDVAEEDGEDIIAKFYKNEDDDFWRVRVVQGDEQPLEDMQFDPELDMVEIIEKIAEIPGYSETQEMETQEYEDLLDDKDIIDQAFYDDIIKEE